MKLWNKIRLCKTLVFCFFLLMSSTCMYAQTTAEKAVAASSEKLRLAMISGDKTSLQQLTLAKLSYGHSGGKVESREAFIASLTSGQSDFVTISIEEQVIDVHGKTAVVRHLLSATTNDNNKPGHVKLKVLLVFAKHKGCWKLLARQAVKAS